MIDQMQVIILGLMLTPLYIFIVFEELMPRIHVDIIKECVRIFFLGLILTPFGMAVSAILSPILWPGVGELDSTIAMVTYTILGLYFGMKQPYVEHGVSFMCGMGAPLAIWPAALILNWVIERITQVWFT